MINSPNNRSSSSSSSDNSPDAYYSSRYGKISFQDNSIKGRLLNLGETGSRLVKDGKISEGLGCYTSSSLYLT